MQVIEPIQSRCAILRFVRLGDAEVLARLQYVCQREQAGHSQSHTLCVLSTCLPGELCSVLCG